MFAMQQIIIDKEIVILKNRLNWSIRLTYRRVVVRLGTSDNFSLRFFSKPSEPTKLQTLKTRN